MRQFLVFALLGGVAAPALAQATAPDRSIIYEDVEVMRRLLADAIARARPPVPVTFWQTRAHYPYTLMDTVRFNNARFGQPDAYPIFIDPVRLNLNTAYPIPLADYLFDDRDVNTRLYSFINTMQAADKPPPPTDGTYLKGVGPIFTLTVDHADAAALEPPNKSASLVANCARCHGAAMDAKVQPPPTAAKGTPVDPWDATLRKVRGESDPPAPKPAATRLNREEICLPGHLTELVFATLTKYGHRFRGLSPTDRLTVIVNVTGVAKPGERPAGDPAAQARSQADEQLALGDLHIKQGKSDEAVSAYRKAIEVLAKPLQFDPATPADQVTKGVEETSKTLRSAHGKLAQALLALGKLDEAKVAIEAAKSASIHLAPKSPKAASPAKISVPTKLTITLTKKTIDDHRAGRLTPAELRAAAEIEAIGFPGREKNANQQ
jgi:hypothetical protein